MLYGRPCFRVLLVTLMLLDWFLRVGGVYTSTGCTATVPNPVAYSPRCVLLLLPYSAMLRPLLWVVNYKTVRLSLFNILQVRGGERAGCSLTCVLCAANGGQGSGTMCMYVAHIRPKMCVGVHT
jgi:hypothetical protein